MLGYLVINTAAGEDVSASEMLCFFKPPKLYFETPFLGFARLFDLPGDFFFFAMTFRISHADWIQNNKN